MNGESTFVEATDFSAMKSLAASRARATNKGVSK
jgi:hypothetical protein